MFLRDLNGIGIAYGPWFFALDDERKERAHQLAMIANEDFELLVFLGVC
jgi:hypothetical protein